MRWSGSPEADGQSESPTMLDVTCNLYTYCMEVLAVFDDGVGVLCQDASFSAISCDLETGASSPNCATNQDLIG